MTGVLSGKTIEEIEASPSTVFVLDDDKNVYSWGRSNALGIDTATDSAEPVAVDWQVFLMGKR